MKKQLLALTLVLSSMSFAQLINYADGGTSIANGGTVTANVTGNTNYVPNYDVMGAHENGGRGCAACHAPHNGAKGNGGNPLGSGYGTSVTNQGGLWGEDTSNIIAYGTITFNGGNSAHSGLLTITAADNAWTSEVYTGVATCLSCHDGSVAQGAMMSGISYEQAFGLLNGVSGVSTGISANRNTSAITTSTLYGPNSIPTLLGGGTGLGYNYTHPVGQTANVGAVLGSVIANANNGLVLGTSTNYGRTVLNVTASSATTPWGIFTSTYKPQALNSMVYESTNGGQDSWVACTTCHNQHNMAVSTKLPSGAGKQARTIFFVNGPYNPGAPYDPTHEPSTMRFCQQCHFSFSSEYYGATNVGTAY